MSEDRFRGTGQWYGLDKWEETRLRWEDKENWRVAQVIEKKDVTGYFRFSNGENLENESQLPRCQVDASWVTNSTVSGGGFVFDLAPGTHTYGSFGMDQVLSPMHAEFTVLLNAMRYFS